MDVRQQYNQVPEAVRVSWRQRENQLADWGLAALSDPRLSNPSQDEAKEVVLWLEELGVNIAVCPVSCSSLKHKKHHPFENKVWEIYFYKEVYSFVHWSSYIMFDYVSAYICITAIQYSQARSTYLSIFSHSLSLPYHLLEWLLTGFCRSFFILKSQRILCVLFTRRDPGSSILHLSAWPNFDLFQNSQ